MTAPVFCPECGARVPTYAEDIVSARAGYRRRLQTLYLVSAVVIGIVFVRLLDWWAASEPSPTPAAVVPAVSIQPTIEVRAVIEWPTATATATPVPTSTQIVVWQPDPCSTPEPGKLCRVPDRAPNTPTPYPSCYGAVEPGKWCRWIVADDAPDGRTETR